MAIIQSRECSCGNQYDVLTVRGQTMSIDREDDEDTCPKCDSGDFTLLVRVGSGIELGGVSSAGKIYPYYDRGLGCMVNDKHHRKQICKQRGLVPVDGDIDVEKMYNKAEARDDGIRKRYKAIQDEYENHPKYADYRRLRDKGYYEDRKEMLKQQYKESNGG